MISVDRILFSWKLHNFWPKLNYKHMGDDKFVRKYEDYNDEE